MTEKYWRQLDERMRAYGVKRLRRGDPAKKRRVKPVQQSISAYLRKKAQENVVSNVT